MVFHAYLTPSVNDVKVQWVALAHHHGNVSTRDTRPVFVLNMLFEIINKTNDILGTWSHPHRPSEIAYLNQNVKLSPSVLLQFKRRRLHIPIWICKTIMKMKYHFFNYLAKILVQWRAQIHRPGMSSCFCGLCNKQKQIQVSIPYISQTKAYLIQS